MIQKIQTILTMAVEIPYKAAEVEAVVVLYESRIVFFR